MSSVQDLMNAIANMEGFNVSGSIANRFNNPGNMRYSPLQSGSQVTASGTFATFASPSEGWAALQSYIESNAGLSLRDFIYKYAPPNENNTGNYLDYVASSLGVSADNTISDIFSSGISNDTSYSSSSFDMSSLLGNMDSTTQVIVGVIGVGLIALVAGD